MTDPLFRESRTGIKRKAHRQKCESCAHTSKRRRKCSFCSLLVGTCCMPKGETECTSCRDVKAKMGEPRA